LRTTMLAVVIALGLSACRGPQTCCCCYMASGAQDVCLPVDEKIRGDGVCNNQPGNQATNEAGAEPYACSNKGWTESAESGLRMTERAQQSLDQCVASLRQ
jgi:hypothetical protein